MLELRAGPAVPAAYSYIKIGAPGTSGDIEIPGVRHMDLPDALADKSALLRNAQEYAYALG